MEERNPSPVLDAGVLLGALAVGGGSVGFSLQTKRGGATGAAEAAALVEAQAQAERERQAAEAAAAAAAAQRPAEVERVQIVLSTDPGGAEVFVDEQSIGTTPLDIEWVGEQARRNREVAFRFVKSGYRPLTVTRVITSDRIAIDSALEALPRTVSTGMSSPSVGGPAVRPSGYRDNPF